MHSETISSFIGDVREVLDDASTPYHYADERVRRAVVDAFRELYRVRPESRYVDSVLNDTEFPTGQELASFSVSYDVRWRLGIVYFAAARCYESDIKDSVNLQMAGTLKQYAAANFAS